MSSTNILMYVPAVKPSQDNTAARIAELIAQYASRARSGTYTIKSQPNSHDSVIVGPDGTEHLTVVEVDYQPSLFRGDSVGSGQATFRGVGWALVYAVMGTARLIRSMTRPAKSNRAKLQLLIGFCSVFVLYASFGVALVALLVAVQPSWIPKALATSSPGIQTAAGISAGTVGAATFWWLRPKMLAAGALLRSLMGYLERDRDLLRVTGVFDQAVDDILDAHPDARVHILAFSFGSIVTLDSLFPRAAGLENRDLSCVDSLVTVGCPVDFVRLFYQDHFADRSARRPGLDWTNVFIPADVLASNFADTKDDATILSPADHNAFRIATETPGHNLAVGSAQLSIAQTITMDGFSLHCSYWAKDEPRYLAGLIPLWLPAPVASP
ncbi:MAG: hypothetical protein QOK10_1232 [Pseudonocardiales bacterium]|jgi:hypothetical protein|nr:hypothetical protein [Pseudonocardiales bacterium]